MIQKVKVGLGGYGGGGGVGWGRAGGVGWDGMGWDVRKGERRWGGVGRMGWGGMGWGEVRQGDGVEWCGGRLPSQVRLRIGILHCLGLIWELYRSKLFNFFKLS